MIKKYYFLFVGLLMPYTNTMELKTSRTCPKLTTFCTDRIAHELAYTKPTQNTLGWIADIELPEEIHSELKYSLIKYFGNYFWRNDKKKFSFQTLSQSLINYGARIANNNNNERLTKHSKNESEKFTGEDSELLALDYDQILQSAKANTLVPDQHERIQKQSPDKSFEIVLNPTHENSLSSYSGTIEVWDSQSKKLLYTLKPSWLTKFPRVRTLTISPDSNFIIVAYDKERFEFHFDVPNYELEGEVAIWDSRTGNHLITLFKQLQPKWSFSSSKLLISAVAVSNDTSLIAVGYERDDSNYSENSYKGLIDVFDIKSGTLLQTFDATAMSSEEATITSIAISDDNKFILVGYDNDLVKSIKIDLSYIDLSTVLNEISGQNTKFNCIVS